MIVKSVLSPRSLGEPIIVLHNEVTPMQANRHSTYQSSYNTQTVTTEQKVEIVTGKPMLKSIAVDASDTNHVAACNSAATKNVSRAFDFAGLAG